MISNQPAYLHRRGDSFAVYCAGNTVAAEDFLASGQWANHVILFEDRQIINDLRSASIGISLFHTLDCLEILAADYRNTLVNTLTGFLVECARWGGTNFGSDISDLLATPFHTVNLLDSCSNTSTRNYLGLEHLLLLAHRLSTTELTDEVRASAAHTVAVLSDIPELTNLENLPPKSSKARVRKTDVHSSDGLPAGLHLILPVTPTGRRRPGSSLMLMSGTGHRAVRHGHRGNVLVRASSLYLEPVA